ncbi:MAG: MCE family protein [Deltaproteobacteria bacterium]|nr:MCE family protein [Deltaproteobacteria bacterium]
MIGKAPEFRVGIFVFLALLAFMGAIVALSERSQLFQPYYSLFADFDNIGGLFEGAPVKLAGLTVGRVHRVAFPADPARRQIRVELKVDERVQPRIRNDSVARIETLGLLGDKYVEVTLGTPARPVLSPGATLKTAESTDYTRLVRRAESLLEGAGRVTESLDRALTSLGRPEVQDGLVRTMQALNRVATQLDQARLVEHLSRASRAVAQAAREVEQGQGLLPALLREPRYRAAADDLVEVARGLARATGDIERGAAQVGRVLAQVDQGVSTLNRALLQLEQGRGAAHALLYDEQGGRAVADLARAAQQSGEVVAQVGRAARQGEAMLSEVGRVARQAEGVVGEVGRAVRQSGELAGEVSQVLRQGEQAVAAFGRAADQVAQVATQLRQGEGLLPALLQDPRYKAIPQELLETSQALRETAARLTRGEGLLPALLDPKLGEEITGRLRRATEGLEELGQQLRQSKELVANLQAASRDLKEVAGNLAHGDGTLRGLIEDPTIYENLAALLEGTNRSTILRWLIRTTIRKGQAPAPDGPSALGGRTAGEVRPTPSTP